MGGILNIKLTYMQENMTPDYFGGWNSLQNCDSKTLYWEIESLRK